MLKLKQYGLLFFLAVILILIMVVFFFQDSNPIQAYPPAGESAYVAPNTPTPNSELAASTPGTEQYYLPGMYRHWVANPKKGLAFKFDEIPTYTVDAINMNFHWYHNWDIVADPYTLSKISAEFVPFIWCKYYDIPPNERLPGDYDGYVLMFNEPDLTDPQYGQCGNHLGTVEEVALEYLKIKSELPNAKLIGPHISHANDPGQWIANWRQEVYDITCIGPNPYPQIPCGYPEVAGYGFHHYSDDTTALLRLSSFCNDMLSWGELDKEIWITEFGWGNFWPVLDPTQSTQEVMQIVDVWENGVDTPGGHCEVNRYAYYVNRGFEIENPPPVIPTGYWYTDLYCNQTFDFSHTGEGYFVSGILGTPPAPGQSNCQPP